jgi:hypothetical protein
MIGCIDHEAIVAKRLQNGGGLGRRLGGEFADCGRRLGKFVVEEFRQRVADGVGASAVANMMRARTPIARKAPR